MQGENSSYSLMLSFQSSSTLLYFDYFNSEVSRSPIWNSIQEKCIYSPSKKFPIPPFLWNFLWSTPRGIAKYRGSEYISFTQFFREHRETFVAFQTQELSRTGASKVAPSRLLKLSFSRSYGNDRSFLAYTPSLVYRAIAVKLQRIYCWWTATLFCTTHEPRGDCQECCEEKDKTRAASLCWIFKLRL